MFDIRRREFITLLGGAAAVGPLPARAQLSGKTYRIGFLGVFSHTRSTDAKLTRCERVFANSDTRRARTLSSTIGGPRADTTASPSSQPSW